ncbi:MAG: hypothetical protein ABI333_01385 [bacterium]
MMKKRSLLVMVGCVAMLGFASCGDDDGGSGVCGDGIATGNEECDGVDLANRTCADVVTGSTGQLTCSGLCTYDVSQCILCGDGVRSFGEDCDCGTGTGTLPAGCLAANGATGSNCSIDCVKIPICGDGQVDTNEDCDCGTNPTSLPVGCPDVNGGNASNCDVDCVGESTCNAGVWEDCDPLVTGDCCEDDWNVQLECSTLPTSGGDIMCMRHCTDTSDCYWNNWCLGPQFGDLCWPAVCAPGGDIDVNPNEYGQVPGGGQCWCLPIFGRDAPTDTPVGWCMEAGTLAHGDVCPANAIDVTDRSELMCDMGICLSAQGALEGTCGQFCNWEQAYAVAFYGAAASTELLPCPSGANCFSESNIDSTTGLRSGDLSYCRDTEVTDPTDGMTTCSLVTNHLLSNPAQTCEDTHAAGARCVMVQFTGGDVTNGSLVGVCMASTAPTHAVWEECDSSNTADVCPSGSICTNDDLFATTPAGPERCVPYCDTENPGGDQAPCEAMGAVPTGTATPTCQSQSILYPPDGPNDISQTRLGFCAF